MKLGNKHRGWCEDVINPLIQEDKIIVELVDKYGTKNWAQIADELHLVFGYARKTGKQCRERYMHIHLDGIITWTLILSRNRGPRLKKIYYLNNIESSEISGL